jgi:hypothetical protein
MTFIGITFYKFPMNPKTTIAAIVLATILAASTVVMALPIGSAEVSRGGDAETGDFKLRVMII